MTHMKTLALAAALALTAGASFADTFNGPLDLSDGNGSFGRDNAIGAFLDTYTFTLAGDFLVSSTASSAAAGAQDLDYSSLLIKNAADATVATFQGNLGTDLNEFYTLPSMLLGAGDYRLVVTGVNSLTQASYTGNLAIFAAPIPEPQTYALLLAGLAAVGFVARRRKPGSHAL